MVCWYSHFPINQVRWHSVSKQVNNMSLDSIQCVKLIIVESQFLGLP